MLGQQSAPTEPADDCAHIRSGLRDDGFCSLSSQEQQHVERRVVSILDEWKTSNKATRMELLREIHTAYLLSGLDSLPAGYASLDASRPWLVYWILHALSLLGRTFEPDAAPQDRLPVALAERCVSLLAACQHPSGGFGGGPGQEPHLAPTYAAVNALFIIGTEKAYNTINRQRLYQFLLRMKQPNGAFSVADGGEIDTRGAYTALAVASLTNLLTLRLSDRLGNWLASCQTHEGGIGGEPGNEAHGGYTFCALAALMILGESQKLNLPNLLHWAASRQMSLEGGFQGRTNKLVDGCYSFWVGALFPLLDFLMSQPPASQVDSSSFMKGPLLALEGEEKYSAVPSQSTQTAGNLLDVGLADRHKLAAASLGNCLFDSSALQRYVLVCCQFPSGGLVDKPGKFPDYYHTCYCLSGLSVAQHSLNPKCFGAPANMLVPVNPVYNIVNEKVNQGVRHFQNLSPMNFR